MIEKTRPRLPFAEPVQFRVADPIVLPLSFYERLIAFYARQQDLNGPEHRGHIWGGIKADFQGELVAALLSGDAKVLERFLARLYMTSCIAGVDWPNSIAGAGGPLRPEEEASARNLWEGYAVAAANNLGVLPVFNPEQPDGEPIQMEALFRRMEAALGVRLHYPGGGAIPGGVVGDRFVPLKLLDAAGVLASLKRLRLWGPIIEIGAGSGFLCYAMSGYWNFEYHIIDLPEMAVVQAYMLRCSGNPVWLSGDPYEGQTLFVHGLNASDAPPPGLVINQNSMPELPAHEAGRHLDYIVRELHPGGTFYSLNHESARGDQSRVWDLMTGYRDRMTLQHRSPWWDRDGYVEEVWVKV